MPPQPPGEQALHAAVIAHEASRSGAPIVLLNLWQELTRVGLWRPSFLCMSGGPLTEEFAALGPTTSISPPGWIRAAARRRLPGRRSDEAREQGTLRRWLRAQPRRPAVAYVNTITLGHIGAVAHRQGIPVVTHVHEMDYAAAHLVPADRVRLAVSTSDLLVAVSEGVRRNLVSAHGADPDRVVTVRGAVAFDEPSDEERRLTRAALGVPDNGFVVLGVGNAQWHKGADLFVQLALRAAPSDPRLRFVWVGPLGEQDLARLEHDVRLGGVLDRVTFVGETDRIRPYYAAADVFCLTSREDSYPLVMLEAATAGLPVVGFARSGGVEEFVSDGGGLVVDYLDVPGMADTVGRLSRDEAERVALATAARQAAARHTVAAASAQIQELLSKVVAAGPRTDRAGIGS